MTNTMPEIDQTLIFLINDDGTKNDDVPQEDYDAAMNLMWADFLASRIGKIMSEYYTDASLNAIDKQYHKDWANAPYGWKTILSHRMQQTCQTMHDAGDPGLDLKESKRPPQPAAPARPARPQDEKTGKFLTDVEIEARADLNHERQEVINEKRRTRADYREAYDLAKFASIGVKVQRSTKPGIEWEPYQPPKPVASQDIKAFARAWKNTPCRNLTPVNGLITLIDRSEYTDAELKDKLNAAAAAGAI